MDYKIILKKLPYEIQEEILNYYYKKSNSYKNYLKSFYNLNRYRYFIKFSKVNKIYHSVENQTPLHRLLFESFNRKDAKRYVNNLAHCNCCERHQQKKPKNLTDRFQYPFNEKDDNFYDDPNICKCTCRHVSRALCFCFSDVFE